ncbi:hypothetical protein BVRB_6g147920 [Beta vulgaris subsp. vulgaris]|nr:hypothetical protein BVRB_6g147920 [Beta vulgaris subsp. vulgaris]
MLAALEQLTDSTSRSSLAAPAPRISTNSPPAAIRQV